jgi:hypothetical protein
LLAAILVPILTVSWTFLLGLLPRLDLQ